MTTTDRTGEGGSATAPEEDVQASATAEAVRSAAQSAAAEMAEMWRQIQQGAGQRGDVERLPFLGPPPAPPGHAPLPSLAEQRRALGLPTDDAQPQTAPAPGISPQSRAGFPRPVPRDPAVYASSIGATSASPDAVPAVERREPGPVISSEGHEVVLPLAAVLCDPKTNVARAGVAWRQDDPEVVDQADAIESFGLKNPIGVRRLNPPVERDVPVGMTTHEEDGSSKRAIVTHYTHQVVDGFKRFAALELLGREMGRFTELDVTSDVALLHNGLENINRTELNDYETAQYLALLARMSGWTADEIAHVIKLKPSRVEQLLLVATRLPRELLERFKASPTPEVRRDLARIARIQRETPEETHQAMIDEWVRVEEGKRAALEQKKEKQARDAVLDGTTERTLKSMGRADVERLRVNACRATEWYDAMNDQWRPVDDEARAFADALLRRVCNPKGRSVLR